MRAYMGCAWPLHFNSDRQFSWLVVLQYIHVHVFLPSPVATTWAYYPFPNFLK
jgi:hypothetical protein